MSHKGDPCSVCLVPLTQDNKTGICQRNLVCKAAYMEVYREVNRVELAVKREAHKGEQAVKAAARYAAHPEKKAAYGAVYYEANKEVVNARSAVWQKAHPETHRAQESRRRARGRVNMTREDRELSVAYRLAIANDVCFYCKERPGEHDDHYQSLANGGTDHWWNLVRSCPPCNWRKHAMNGDEFVSLLAGEVIA